MDLQREQSEILDLVDSMKRQGRTKGWSKYYGDAVCRIVARYLSKHLSPSLKVVGPDAYIVGFPIEFDLLVCDAKAIPIKFTNAYLSSQLYCVIEVKMTGIIEKKERFSAKVSRIRDNFQSLVKENPNLKCTYIAISEGSPTPKKMAIYDPETMRFHQETAPQTAFDFVKETRKALEPFPFFTLRNSRNKKAYEGQWESFVKFISS